MHNGQAPLQVHRIEAFKRKLYLRPDGRLGRWVYLEPKDAWRADGRKTKHIRKIGVECDQNPALPDRKLPNPSIRFA